MPDETEVGDDHSVRGAARAAAEGRLADWVTDFLASPGSDNEPLAAELAFEGRCWAGPRRVRLDRLQKLAGPGDEVLVPIDDDRWEDDVDDMEESLEEGWEPPPLLVSWRDGSLWIEDGNHRHETLLRAGRTHAWALLAFDSEVERQRFLALASEGREPEAEGGRQRAGDDADDEVGRGEADVATFGE